MNIAFFSSKKFEKSYFDGIASSHHIEFFDFLLTAKTASVIDNHDAVCIFVNDIIDKACVKVLKQKKVKIIALRCSGYNNIDLEACRKANITVVNVPQYSPHAVAEHALTLLLCLNRKIHKAYARIKEGNFDLNGLEGFDLYQKTVGIIGVGAIGQVFAQICHGLGCKVLAHDPIPKNLNFIDWVDLPTLFKASDVISLHCPLTPTTQHIINPQSIRLMKNNVLLINTGRGALIDSYAIIQALKKKNIAGVALDVYEMESGVFFADHSMDIIQDDTLMRLITFPNVLITSHQGFLTHEALQHIAQTTMLNLNQVNDGQFCANIL